LNISTRKKFIFIHIPKTAGLSITVALKQWLDFPPYYDLKFESKYLTVASRSGYKIFRPAINKIFPLVGLQVNPYNIKWRHASLFDIAKYVDLNKYFKFSFVRNPIEREYSLFNYINRTPGHIYHNVIKGFTFKVYLKFRISYSIADRLQSDYLYNERDELMVNYIGRF